MTSRSTTPENGKRQLTPSLDSLSVPPPKKAKQDHQNESHEDIPCSIIVPSEKSELNTEHDSHENSPPIASPTEAVSSTFSRTLGNNAERKEDLGAEQEAKPGHDQESGGSGDKQHRPSNKPLLPLPPLSNVASRRLALLQKVRDIEIRPRYKFNINVTRHPHSYEAALAQERGTLPQLECSHCANDLRPGGPFQQCVVISGFFGGACANCRFGANQSRCSFWVNKESRALLPYALSQPLPLVQTLPVSPVTYEAEIMRAKSMTRKERDEELTRLCLSVQALVEVNAIREGPEKRNMS